jgi:alkanesulfonate monooxygenase SsuD/methylene tetrahydromethanopterin reductase-like flavin-dependent oxidoreductase (luciferase family)
VVGGNGREVTWRIAARYADELNLDNPAPEEMAEAMAVIASRCEEIGRDPASLAVSVHIWWAEQAAEMLVAAREAGFSRAMALVRGAAQSTDAVDAFAETCRSAGVELAGPAPSPGS